MSPSRLQAPTSLGPESNGMSMTPAEFDAVEEWDERYRYELVRRVAVVTPPPGAGERKANDVLGHCLLNYQQSLLEGAALDDTLPEQELRAGENRRRADRAVWTGLGRAPDPDTDVPTIAIEIVSATRRDRQRDCVERRREYADMGVAEYWVIDRFDRTMTVVRGDEERVLREGEVYTTDLLPGFELPLDRLFAAANRYG